MSPRQRPSGFARRPSDQDAWVRTPEPAAKSTDAYTARLTIDVTPILRGRIKITAFERGVTVAEMLRTLLEREYGGDDFGGSGAP